MSDDNKEISLFDLDPIFGFCAQAVRGYNNHYGPEAQRGDENDWARQRIAERNAALEPPKPPASPAPSPAPAPVAAAEKAPTAEEWKALQAEVERYRQADPKYSPSSEANRQLAVSPTAIIGR